MSYGHPMIGKVVRHRLPSHLVHIPATIKNFSDCRVTMWRDGTRRTGKAFRLQHMDIDWVDEVDEPTVDGALRLAQRRKYPASASDLGYDVGELKMERVEIERDRGVRETEERDGRVKDAMEKAAVAALTEIEMDIAFKDKYKGKKNGEQCCIYFSFFFFFFFSSNESL